MWRAAGRRKGIKSWTCEFCSCKTSSWSVSSPLRVKCWWKAGCHIFKELTCVYWYILILSHLLDFYLFKSSCKLWSHDREKSSWKQLTAITVRQKHKKNTTAPWNKFIKFYLFNNKNCTNHLFWWIAWMSPTISLCLNASCSVHFLMLAAKGAHSRPWTDFPDICPAFTCERRSWQAFKMSLWQMEHFVYPCDIFHKSIWEATLSQGLEMKGYGTSLLSLLSVKFKTSQSWPLEPLDHNAALSVCSCFRFNDTCR